MGACQDSTPPTSIVLASMTSYQAALVLAVKYNQLPRCAASESTFCSDPAVLKQLRMADDAALAALKAAQNVVLTPGATESAIAAAQASATQAVTAFQSILAIYNVK
jgi:hypothetical protein